MIFLGFFFTALKFEVNQKLKVMKRKYVLGMSTLLLSGAVLAQADRSELPQPSTDFIDQHFSSEKITEIDVDDSWYNMSDSETYEVEFESGIEMDFNKKGEITEIETEERVNIPFSVFPEAVRTNLEREHPEVDVVAWEKGKNGHEIELRDGTELWFDNNGNMKQE